jgi:hypothetical protein
MTLPGTISRSFVRTFDVSRTPAGEQVPVVAERLQGFAHRTERNDPDIACLVMALLDSQPMLGGTTALGAKPT